MKIRVAVITASTTGYAGKREDISGAKICEIVEEAGMEWKKPEWKSHSKRFCRMTERHLQK